MVFSPLFHVTFLVLTLQYFRIKTNLHIITLGMTNLGIICDAHEIDKQKEIQFKRDYNDFRFKLHQVRLCR